MKKETLNILFIGDVVGKIGRLTIKSLLPKIKEQYQIDLVIANGENIAHGKGLTVLTVKELMNYGVDYLTSGDHCFDQKSNVEECFNSDLPVLRPLNYSDDAPGQGYSLIEVGQHKILLVNLIGRSFMKYNYNCPFRAAEKIINDFTDEKISAIIIDIHAETTAEKIALKHFLDGKISALLGTHTHVPTADATITSLGTGYITDIGMTGYADGVIGVMSEPIIESFLTQTKIPHQLAATGQSQFNAIKLTIDPKTKQSLEIKLIQETITILD
jgi:hypothetical protein